MALLMNEHSCVSCVLSSLFNHPLLVQFSFQKPPTHSSPIVLRKEIYMFVLLCGPVVVRVAVALIPCHLLMFLDFVDPTLSGVQSDVCCPRLTSRRLTRICSVNLLTYDPYHRIKYVS